MVCAPRILHLTRKLVHCSSVPVRRSGRYRRKAFHGRRPIIGVGERKPRKSETIFFYIFFYTSHLFVPSLFFFFSRSADNKISSWLVLKKKSDVKSLFFLINHLTYSFHSSSPHPRFDNPFVQVQQLAIPPLRHLQGVVGDLSTCTGKESSS